MSKIYTDYVISKKNNKLIFDMNDNKYFREDEIDYVSNMIDLKAQEMMTKKPSKNGGGQLGLNSEEMVKLCSPFI